MEFLNAYYFLGIFLLVPLFYVRSRKLPFSKETAEKIVIKGKISKKTKFYILIASLIMFIIALARPIINNGFTTVKAPAQNIVIGLDVSKGMKEHDLYPNREEFAKEKIKLLLKHLNRQNVALVLFDKNSYLVSPPSSDYDSLTYLLNHTDTKNLQSSFYPDIYNFLKSASALVKNPKAVIFTWGGGEIKKAYDYSVTKGIKTYVYLCAKNTSDYPPNPEISVFQTYTPDYSNKNILELAKTLNKSKQKDIKIRDKTELFYYPLSVGIVLMLFVIFYPFRRKK